MADCNKIKNDGVKEITKLYNENIKEIAILIDDYNQKGLDPTKFNPGIGKELVDLYDLIKDFERQKQLDISEHIKEVEEKCKSDTEEILQAMVTAYTEAILVKYTKGLSVILPKHMKHIDVGEILKGKPLGGKNSLVNKFRDDMLKGLGLGENNDVTKIIKDPIKTTKKTINKVLKPLGIRL